MIFSNVFVKKVAAHMFEHPADFMGQTLSGVKMKLKSAGFSIRDVFFTKYKEMLFIITIRWRKALL